MTIARNLTSDQAEDAIKYGEGLVSGQTADDLAQKQAIPHKIVLSMTTSPKRMKHLHNQLQVIHPAMVDSIEINVPKVYKPTGETYEIPITLTSLPKVKIF
jgi:phosphopantetheine adenylyltransferase